MHFLLELLLKYIHYRTVHALSAVQKTSSPASKGVVCYAKMGDSAASNALSLLIRLRQINYTHKSG